MLARGARKVYAGARDPSTITQAGMEPPQLDVTKPAEVAAAAAHASDVTLVVNNAGIAQLGGFLTHDSEEVSRRLFETNFFGMLQMSKAFASVLRAIGGGALLNVLSVASWVNGGELAAYSASKSAAWSLTNALRNELAAQKTQVLGLHMAYVDTSLAWWSKSGLKYGNSNLATRSTPGRTTFVLAPSPSTSRFEKVRWRSSPRHSAWRKPPPFRWWG